MDYQVHVETVPSQLTGVVRERVAPHDLAVVVPAACGEVWTFMRAAGLPRPGRNLALYLDSEINLECGVEVPAPFAGNGRVVQSSTPAGAVATTTHFGSYAELGQAHAAVQAYCREQGLTLAGPNWEIYGHWDPAWDTEPARIRTDVFYLLEPAGAARV